MGSRAAPATERLSAETADAGIAAWLNVNVRLWRAASLLVVLVVTAPVLVVVAALVAGRAKSGAIWPTPCWASCS